MTGELRILMYIYRLLSDGDPLGEKLWKVWTGESR
jgi:hypothetical protein